MLRFNLGRCLEELGRPREAISAFERYLDTPDSETARARATERIAALEEEQTGLHARLSDPEFYKSAGSEVVVINARLGAIETELEAAYLRWDELESLKSPG